MEVGKAKILGMNELVIETASEKTDLETYFTDTWGT